MIFGYDKTGFVVLTPEIAIRFYRGKKYHCGWPESWPDQLDKILKGFACIWSEEFISRYRQNSKNHKLTKQYPIP